MEIKCFLVTLLAKAILGLTRLSTANYRLLMLQSKYQVFEVH